MLPFDRRDIAESDMAAASALGLRERPLASEMIALEPRMVFDGAAAATAVEVKQAADAAVDTTHHDTTDPVAEATAKLAASLVGATSETTTETTPPAATTSPREIIFIDSRVSDADAFRNKAGANTLVITVGADEDGLSVISRVLSEQTVETSALHIIGHGQAGA